MTLHTHFSDRAPLRILAIFAVLILAGACTPPVTFQVQRPAKVPVQEQIDHLAIGSFRLASGDIPVPDATSGGFSFSSGAKKGLSPSISGFRSEERFSGGEEILELVRAAVVHQLSLNAPYGLINTSGKAEGFTGSIPDEARVGILEATIRFSENRFESNEPNNFLAVIQNKGVSLEQQLLATAGSVAVESAGAGKELPVPYVEHLAALEVQFRLIRKSNGEELAVSEPLLTYYARKWGGRNDTSHLPGKAVLAIQQGFQQDEASSSGLSSGVNRAQLAISDPAEYLSRGYHLKQHSRVALSALAIRTRMVNQVAQRYVQQISPSEEATTLEVLDGDAAAATLIRGNAYEEAIARIQGLESKSAEDWYNLGLAYEATGQRNLARGAYEEALAKDSGNSMFEDALQRLR